MARQNHREELPRRRAKRSLGSALIALFIAGTFACSVVVAADELNEGCPEGSKSCLVEGVTTCVSTQDPAYGCGEAQCIPCGLAHATTVCNPARECDIGSCAANWSNCNGLPEDGCEINTSNDLNNCGECRTVCGEGAVLNNVETYACGASLCKPLVCKAGFVDCDARRTNGCEAQLAVDKVNCGECGVQCSIGQECIDGDCG